MIAPKQQPTVTDEQLMVAVNAVVKRLIRKFSFIERDELVASANVGVAVALRGFDSGKGKRSDFTKWLLYNGYYKAIDDLRERGLAQRTAYKHKKPVLRPLVARGADLPLIESDSGHVRSLEETLEDRSTETIQQRRAGIRQFFNGMSVKDKTLLLMYYADGMTMKQIATAFGVSESAISLRHKRVIRYMRKCIKRETQVHARRRFRSSLPVA